MESRSTEAQIGPLIGQKLVSTCTFLAGNRRDRTGRDLAGI